MKKTISTAFWTGLVCLSCSSPSPTPEVETEQLGQALNFVSNAGVVSAEAENFSSNTAAGAYTWALRNESSAAGGVAMFAGPDNGTANNTGYTTTSPRLDFVTNFAQTGTYQVWVRGRDSGATAGNSDSVHVGLDGQALTSADRITGFTTAFGWTRATIDNVNATLNVTTTGQHTINVWMREDGFIFDKLVLTTSTSFTPSGTGPAETAQSTSSCTDGVRNGTETGIDCGGSCPACPTCTDGVRNGTETGVDCGGSCSACTTPTASAVWLEAESGTRSGSPTFTVQSDTTASGGSYILPPTGSSASAAGAARSTYTVSVAAGTYKLWGRVLTPNADDDSFWVSVDNGSFVKWNGTPNSSSWVWDDVHNSDASNAVVTYALTAGTHTITFANREDGARLDRLYLTKNGDTPTGLGGGGATCSDGIQNQSETGVDCGGPCAACQTCGNGTCSASESCQTCSADCGVCASCGDGTCSATESCSTCASDCGVCSTWSNRDIGAVGAAGRLTQSGGTFTLIGSGDDIHSTYGTPLDEFHFAYQQVVGDVTLVARVASVQNTNEWAKAGVMIRETLAADSKFAFALARPDKQVQAQFRSQTATTGTDSGNQTGGTTAAKWVMVERSGNQFRTYYSTDGTNFTPLGTATTISMAQTVYVGLAVTSHADGTLCTAQFDDVELSLANVCGDATCSGAETCTSCSADCGACGTSGLDARPANTTCVAPAPLSSNVGFSDVWSAITFTNPMQVVQPPGDNSRLIVVQRAGTARSVPMGATSSAQATNFLTLSNVVTASNGGFLSLAFHPNWAQNRYAYVVYTTSNLMKRLSRFQSTDGGATLNASTEQVILQSQHLTEFNHNGGQIAFGKDGYLYMSTGDDAYLNYTRARHSAQTNNWFGKVLRIDVNQGSPYSIPASNPFAQGGGSPEVYAYGLRNPWRFSFDRQTGELWLADVGEDTWEEVNIIQSGGFYGWPYREGDACFSGNTADCNTPYVSPTYRYTSSAASISGGFVYRGSTLASLNGKYVFGDFVTGEVSILDRSSGVASAIPGSTAGGAVAAFGEDNAGELYVVRYSTGRIQKLVAQSGGGATDFPSLLSATGCFSTSNPTQVVSGVIPYTVAQPFWSDGVAKERYVALPNGTTMTIDASGDWEIPPGAVTIKNFRHEGKLFETRFLVRHTNGTYSAYTYEWNDQETQASLVPVAGKSRSLPGLDWTYPSRGECFACHTNAANYALGLETRQLNVNGHYPSTGRTANQRYTFDSIGMLSGNRTPMTPFPDIADSSATVDLRAQAYLHVNCSNCHRPGGPGGGPMDARFTTPFANKHVCEEPATLGGLGLPDPVLVAPGDHLGSVLWLRMNDRGNPYSMPPLASSVADYAGSYLLQSWIDNMTACP
jgi:uncharacterized repeat protein (TIGR03806 family)